MAPESIKIGSTYYCRRLTCQCIITYRTRAGYWITCWGGPSGDKKYTFKGISADELEPLNKPGLVQR